jgi:hypothetical protein
MKRLIAPALIVLGAVVMVALWPLFTSLHGPTSVNLERPFLGRDPLFWGAMMEGVSGALIVAGLLLWRRLLVAGKLSRVGYVLALATLALPTLLTLVFLAPMPPLLQPLLGVGLILLAWGNPRLPRVARVALVVIGALFIAALWSAFIPIETWDSLHGYRIYGVMTNVLVGIAWIVFAVSAGRQRVPAPE